MNRFKPIRAAAITATLLLVALGTTRAADHVVKMLNVGKDGSMVFEPAFVKAAVGDTVVVGGTRARL